MFAEIDPATNYTFTGLSTSQTYFFKVQAITGSDAGKLSDEISASLLLAGSPTGITLTGSGTAVTVNWTAPTDTGGLAITGYNIFKSTNNNNTPFTTVGVQNAYNFGNLTPGYTYYFKVQAITEAGAGSISSSVTKNMTLASAPTLSSSNNTNSMALSWNTPSAGGSAITGYRIYKGSTTSNLVAYVTTAASTHSYTINNLSYGQATYITVKAVTAYGESTASNMLSYTPQPTVGVTYGGGTYIGNSSVGGVIKKLIIYPPRYFANYTNASAHCSALDVNGYSDWKLATYEYGLWYANRNYIPISYYGGSSQYYRANSGQVYNFYYNKYYSNYSNSNNYYYHCARGEVD